MKRLFVALVAVISLGSIVAIADFNGTAGSGLTFFDFTCFTTKHCIPHVPINSSGTEIMTTGAPGQVGAPAGAMADGWDATQGAKADSVASTDTGTFSLMALIKRLNQSITSLIAAVQASIPAGTNVIGFTSNDPCSQATKLGAPIALTASGQIIAGTSAKKTYICSADLIVAGANNIALVEGTGSVCATNIFGLAGGTTAASGWNFAANGGLTKGSGAGTVYSPSADTNAAAANVCLLLSGSATASGHFTYVQQ